MSRLARFTARRARRINQSLIGDGDCAAHLKRRWRIGDDLERAFILGVLVRGYPRTISALRKGRL